MDIVGVGSLPVVLLTGGFSGGIIALQLARRSTKNSLRRLGGVYFHILPSIVVSDSQERLEADLIPVLIN
jgi:hypothetical protein